MRRRRREDETRSSSRGRAAELLQRGEGRDGVVGGDEEEREGGVRDVEGRIKVGRGQEERKGRRRARWREEADGSSFKSNDMLLRGWWRI